MNKRGEKLMVFWWFLASMLVTVVIVLTSVNFFTQPVDVRSLQMEMVYSNLYDCLVRNSYLVPEIIEDNFDLSGFCNLRETENLQALKFMIRIDVIDKDSMKSILSSPIKVGDGSLYSDCDVGSGIRNVNFPYCMNRTNIIPVYYFEEGDTRKVAFLNFFIASQYNGNKVSVIALNEEGIKNE